MMSFRKVAVFIALVGLMFGLASMVDASSHQRPGTRARGQTTEITGRQGAPQMILQGPVVSVSPGTGFLVIRHGAGREAEEIPVEVDAKTTLTRAGRSINISEVQPGNRVRISYSGSPGDVSKTVEVMGGAGRAAGRGTRS